MARGEFDRLLNDRVGTEYRNFIRRFAIYLLLGFIAVVLIILLIAGLYSVRGRIKNRHAQNATGGAPKKNKEAEPRVMDLSKHASKDFSKFLAVVNVSAEGGRGVAEADGDGGGHMYIVKGEASLTDEQACGVESVLRLFPDKNIYVLDFNKKENDKYDRCSAKPNYLGLLLLLYRERLQLVLVDRHEFFKDSPLREVAKSGNHTQFLGLLLAAFRYGGFVATPDVIMTDRYFVQCLPDRTLVEPFAVIAPAKNDSYLGYLIESLGQCWPSNATPDEVIAKSLDAYNEAQVKFASIAPRRLRRTEVCSTVKSPCPFLRLDEFRENSKWILGLSPFCKQVVQANLGIRVNKMEVEDETKRIREKIRSQKNACNATRTDRR